MLIYSLSRDKGGEIMEFLQNILTVLQIFVGVVTMIFILLQDANERSNIIVPESSKGSNMGSSRNEKLAKRTKVLAIIYVVLSIFLGVVMTLTTVK